MAWRSDVNHFLLLDDDEEEEEDDGLAAPAVA